MANALHSAQTPTEGIHVPYNWEYADEAARLAATGFVSADIGKMAIQADTCTLWILASTAPSWCAVSGSATEFLSLTDTPSSYTGQTGKTLVVNVTETALEFTDIVNVDSAFYLIIEVRKGSSGTISKGDAVYLSGYNVGGWTEVEKAQADSASTMPVVGIATEAITNAANGTVLVSGQLSGIDTSTWSVGDSLYVSSSVAGGLVNTRPTGATSLIQRMGEVVRSDGLAGIIQIVGAGRTNALPNLTAEYEWEGDSDGIPQEVVRYGAARQYAESEGSSTTTSTSYTEKVSLTTSSLLAGTYRISWYAEAGGSSKPTWVQVHRDDTEVLGEVLVEPDGGDPFGVCGFKEMSLTAGVHTFDIDFRSDGTGSTASIRRARVSCIRVA